MSTTKTKRRGRPATNPATVERRKSHDQAQAWRKEAAAYRAKAERMMQAADALNRAADLLDPKEGKS